jgi:hypothetical protein
MNHGLMNGMFWAGVLLSSIPVMLGIAIAAYVVREWKADRDRRRAGAGTKGE